MRMNDYEFDFVKDCADKKNVARSAKNTRTHCGKRGAVRLPSDNLTKKELNAMNGEVINYKSLKGPMNYKEFKELPDDLKREYITYLREKFGAPDKYIAEMLGVSGTYLGLYLRDLNLSAGKNAGNGNKKWEKEKFYAWTHGIDENAVEGTAEVEPDCDITDISEDQPTEPETSTAFTSLSDKEEMDVRHDDSKKAPENPSVTAVPISGSMTFKGTVNDILSTLSRLIGSESVTLTVNWVVDNQ